MADRRLQLMDAHYLYRGLTFAIKLDALGLETPEEQRINFVETTRHRLTKLLLASHLMVMLENYHLSETFFNVTSNKMYQKLSFSIQKETT
jgi:hypothetical protein